MSQMDLFELAGLVIDERPAENPNNKTKEKGKKKKSEKPSPNSMKSSVPKFDTPNGMRNMLVPIDFSISYSGLRFSVEDLARKRVGMESEPVEQVKEAIWQLVPEEIRAMALEARKKKAEAAPVPAGGEDASGEAQQSVETLENQEAASDMPAVPADEKNSAKKEEEFLDGDITIDLLREALAVDYWEFDNPNDVRWRVDRSQKRISTSIAAGKYGSGKSIGSKQFFWRRSELESLDRRGINIVASSCGRLYEVRENPFMRVTVEADEIRELDAFSEKVEIKMPKLPGKFLLTTLNFFKHFAQLGVEVAVYVAWNMKKNEYELHCPKQIVGPEFVEAQYPDDDDRLNVLFMHSHHRYPAFFSPQDDAYAKAFGIYGVFGRLDQPKIQHRFRAGFNNKHVPVAIQNLFDLSHSEPVQAFPWEWMDQIKIDFNRSSLFVETLAVGGDENDSI